MVGNQVRSAVVSFLGTHDPWTLPKRHADRLCLAQAAARYLTVSSPLSTIGDALGQIWFDLRCVADAALLAIEAEPTEPVACTENLIQVDAVMESPKLAE